tara:strand:+ start:2059 stop:5121 length:3063 start_codon:yes stop_codon:yes gene_type:complete
MGLIGEILKGSQALRYHAKSADVAGKNLANVNDPSYARQRVLAKEAYMYADSFSLSTGALRADGLDHMRSDLLDRRVLGEVGGGGSLEARKEILDLLQLILGEKVNRQSLNAGLDDMHESDLAPGSLTRALNDFFNAYQELSAAPTEESVKQELIHKAKTLVARINEAGNRFEDLDEDLSETVQNETKLANDLLAKIHIFNRDIRRFELQGKGRATDLRDLRQKALEDLAKIMDYTATDDVDAATGEGTGLINLSVKAKDGTDIVLLDVTGPKTLSTDAKLDFTMDAPTGEGATAAKIRAVIDNEGKLAEVEILDGGSGYDDSKASVNFTFALPTTAATAGVADAANATTITEKIAAFTATGLVENIATGTTKYNRTTDGLTESATDVVVNTFADAPADITLRPYKAGDVVVDGENYYQALVDTLPWDTTLPQDDANQTGATLSDTKKFIKLTTLPDAVGVDSYDVTKTRSTGYNKGDLVENGGTFYQAIAEIGPVVTETGVDGDLTEVATQAYQQKDVINYNGIYYQSKGEVAKGAALTLAGDGTLTAGTTTFHTLGAELPIIGQEQILSRTQDQTFVTGDYLFDGEQNRYYQAIADFNTAAEANNGSFAPETSGSLIEVNAFVDPVSNNVVSRTGQSFDADKFVALSVSYVYPDGTTTSTANAPVAAAEAVIKNGSIVGFKITNEGSGYPLTDSIFIDDVALDVTSGSIHGYQQARQVEMENFRNKLNTLVGDVVTKVNQIYNPEDEPGKYVFGFPAMLTRPTQGSNELYPGEEGDGAFSLYKDETDLVLPYAESDTFTVVNASAFFPTDRGTDRELLLDDPNFSKVYVGARRMQNVSIENDMKWVGDDGIAQTNDDGRSIIMGYDQIPFRMVQGDNTFIFGDNFVFDVMPQDDRNLAKSLQLDESFNLEGLIATLTTEEGANEVALGIAELGNGDFTEQIATLATDVGTSLGDVVDNLEHQTMVEGLLIDERQSVSAVSMDEEVANLMRYQRAFQASSRVITTLDSMLELVVMGLIR